MVQLVKYPQAMWGPGLDPWVGKIPWRREQLPTPVFWPGEYSLWSQKESEMTEQLSLSVFTTGTKGRGFISKIWEVLFSAF